MIQDFSRALRFIYLKGCHYNYGISPAAAFTGSTFSLPLIALQRAILIFLPHLPPPTAQKEGLGLQGRRSPSWWRWAAGQTPSQNRDEEMLSAARGARQGAARRTGAWQWRWYWADLSLSRGFCARGHLCVGRLCYRLQCCSPYWDAKHAPAARCATVLER